MFRRSSNSAGAATVPSPPFPTYLLPSLRLPLGRRRDTSRTCSSGSTDAASDNDSVPSLASSPASSSSSSGSGSNSDSPSRRASPAVFTDLFRSASRARDRTLPEACDTASPAAALSRLKPDTLRCGWCSADVAYRSQIISKGFTGRHGRAWLVAPPPRTRTATATATATTTATGRTDGNLVNIRVGRPESRQLVTGVHEVADISCAMCGARLGWKYVDAREPAQKYKVGKFILETYRVVAHHSWEHFALGGRGGERRGLAGRHGACALATGSELELDDGGDDRVAILDSDEDPVEFDSEDEDECDDIFAGVWDADIVRKRRRGKTASVRRDWC